jgi:hypothetical protein
MDGNAALVLPMYLLVKFGLITFLGLYFYNVLHPSSAPTPVKLQAAGDQVIAAV